MELAGKRGRKKPVDCNTLKAGKDYSYWLAPSENGCKAEWEPAASF